MPPPHLLGSDGMPSGQAAGVGMAGQRMRCRKERGLPLVSESSFLGVCLQGPDTARKDKKNKESSGLVYLDTRVFFHVRGRALPGCCLP